MRRNFPGRFSCPVGGVADQRRLIASRAIVVEFKGSLGGARMAASAQYEADRGDGSNIDGDSSGQQPSFAAQLRKTLNTYTWYAVPSGTLTFVNEAYADYLGLAKDDPLRLGLETGVAWDTHIELVHPDDREETLRVGATCNRTGAAGQAAFRIRNSEGGYRWFLSRLEPLRASDGTLLYWIGINLDIEELKRAEEQRRIAEEKIREQEMELRVARRHPLRNVYWQSPLPIRLVRKDTLRCSNGASGRRTDNMPSPEKDRLAAEAMQCWADFQEGLSSHKQKYPVQQFRAFWAVTKRYAELTRSDLLIHRSVAGAVNGLLDFLEVERKRVPGDVLSRC
jgi:PAS domain S-box-containing protein